MGADGHITLWQREKAIATFTEADKLFELLPNCYRNELAGVTYYHAYHGDNMSDDWREFADWSTRSDGYPSLDRQLEFFRWLQANCGERWEVWT